MDLIILYFLCKKIGKIALAKGLNAGRWKLYTALSFLGAEIFGLNFGFATFGNGNLADLTKLAKEDPAGVAGIAALGLICAFGGYLIVKANLDKKPDNFDEEDVNKIGINDLQPPRKN